MYSMQIFSILRISNYFLSEISQKASSQVIVSYEIFAFILFKISLDVYIKFDINGKIIY